jgi:hypothetical protein
MDLVVSVKYTQSQLSRLVYLNSLFPNKKDFLQFLMKAIKAWIINPKATSTKRPFI